mmetsp:Transcript_28611/g.80604  ORF Transcript_28611/g.80604 Transcript_28611/m.80604 type:complete len:271 (+) Transcript_28611:293-1105(+)
MEVVAEFHEVFDVIDNREVYLQQLEELRFSSRQRLACKDLQEVSKIIATVESDPPYLLVQHNSRGHEKLAELRDINASLLYLIEIDATLLQQLNAALRIHVIREPKLPEVELPHTQLAVATRKVSMLVAECKPKLNELQHIHIAPQSLIGVLPVLEGAHRTCHNSREFSVHGQVGVFVNNGADDGHLFLQVFLPYLPDAEGISRGGDSSQARSRAGGCTHSNGCMQGRFPDQRTETPGSGIRVLVGHGTRQAHCRGGVAPRLWLYRRQWR